MKVAIFITCLSDSIYPRVGEAMARILARSGVKVEFPKTQTCCGQPAFNSGFWEEAKSAAETLISAFEPYDFVISPSGSCTGMIQHYYPKLFEHDPDKLNKVEDLRAKTYEFSQFMIHVLGVEDLKASYPYKITYHPSCHGSRLLGVKEEPKMLLDHVNGAMQIPLPFAEDCCGFGGTFAVKMSDISGAMVTEKSDHILETEAEVLVGTDMGCLMNISGNLHYRGEPIRVMHIAELLYEGIINAEKQG